MNCKVCNTHIPYGDATCPNCGRDAGPARAYAPKSESRLASSYFSSAREEEEEVELELNEVTGEPDPPVAPTKPPARPTRAAANKQATPRPGDSQSQGVAPLFAPDAKGLRALLAEQPASLEPGLAVYRNEKGEAVGAEFETGVGDIDLLATDEDGYLVVVMIADGDDEDLVAQVLQRLGWVRKHVGDGDPRVRGIVLCESAPENLSYAAAALSDKVAFKSYRVALTFQDIDV